MKLSEVLTGPETWQQGSLDNGRQRCLIGALQFISGLESFTKYLLETQRLTRMIQAEYGPIVDVVEEARIGQIMCWNDARGRTWEEIAHVVEAYDRDRMLNP